MKIGFVLDDSLDKTDGVQQYILTLGHWYQQQGHEVHYLVGQTKRRDIPKIHSLSRNIQVRFNQNRMSTPLPAQKRRIKTLLKKQQFDVLHVQMPYSPFLAARIIRYASPKTAIIGTFHIVPYAWQERLGTRVLRWWLWRSKRRFDLVVSVSEPARKFAKKSFGVSSEVVPNAVNITMLHKGKKLRKYADGKVNIVFLGRLVERKGCMEFLKTIQAMHEAQLLSGIRVIICGKGPQQESLEAYVRKHRLSKNVFFVGFVSESDKPDYLASADIAVFPSTGGESFGIVLIEAMAARASVVIGGDNPGYRSVLGARPNQLFNPTDHKQFTKTLKYFSFNQPARQRASVWQASEISHYDVSKVGRQLLALYEQIIAKKRPEKDNVSHGTKNKS